MRSYEVLTCLLYRSQIARIAYLRFCTWACCTLFWPNFKLKNVPSIRSLYRVDDIHKESKNVEHWHSRSFVAETTERAVFGRRLTLATSSQCFVLLSCHTMFHKTLWNSNCFFLVQNIRSLMREMSLLLTWNSGNFCSLTKHLKDIISKRFNFPTCYQYCSYNESHLILLLNFLILLSDEDHFFAVFCDWTWLLRCTNIRVVSFFVWVNINA